MLEEDMDKVKKSQVVKYLKVKRLELLRIVRGRSEAALVKPVFKKDWSVKDVFAHLAFWDWWTLIAIELILAGIMPPYYDDATDDEVNAKEVARRRSQTGHQVLAEFKKASQAVIWRLMFLSDESFYQSTGLFWQGKPLTVARLFQESHEGGDSHYHAHIEQLKALKVFLNPSC